MFYLLVTSKSTSKRVRQTSIDFKGKKKARIPRTITKETVNDDNDNDDEYEDNDNNDDSTANSNLDTADSDKPPEPRPRHRLTPISQLSSPSTSLSINRKKSAIWNYFSAVDKSSGKATSSCLRCGKA